MRRPSESPTELQSELPSESPTQHAASLGVTHHLTRASGCGARNLAMVAHVTSRACSCGARRPTRVAHVTSPAWRTSPHQRGGASVGSPEWRTWRSSPHALPAVSCLCTSWRHWDGDSIRDGCARAKVSALFVQILASLGRPLDTIPADEVAHVCKHSCQIRMVRTRSLEAEYTEPNTEVSRLRPSRRDRSRPSTPSPTPR